VLLKNVGRVVTLPLKELSLSENVRKYIPTDTPEFEELVADIKKNGIDQNLVADLRIEPDGSYHLNIVAGQRRYLAGLAAGVENCTVRIKQYTDRGSRIAQGIAENILREDLHPLDLAEGFAELLKEGWSEAEVAESFDRRRQTVLQLLRLARYPESAKSVIREHMEEFTAYDLLNKFVAHRWKDEASLVEALKSHVEWRAAPRVRVYTDDLLKFAGLDLSKKSGYKIRASGTRGVGQVVIKWENEEQQRRLFEFLEGITADEK
jgi:ParB/RepB/Spo0J family partition protein